jgi:hypothetical protein
MPSRLIMLGLALLGLIIAGGIWGLHGKTVQPDTVRKTELIHVATRPVLQERASVEHYTSPASPTSVDPREERRKATDYRQLMNLLLPLARAGSAPAQYELASALRYCDENIQSHFISPTTGQMKTQEDIRRLYGKLNENTRQLLEESYQRCQTFLADLSPLKTYSDWLDQSAKAGYPPAVFMQADLMLKPNLLSGDSAEIERARQLAISASASADPAVLFGMAEFVDLTGKTPEQAGQLISAWWLVACERGYDCSAQSDVARSTCTVDPQCANAPTVVEELQRVNGAKFDEIQQLAELIGAAIDSGDVHAIRKYL